MTEPRQRSHSQLSSFAECSYRYYLQRVRHVPTAQAVWFAGGRAFHTTAEWLDRELFRNQPVLEEAGRRKLAKVWAEKFGQEVEETRQKEPDLSKWRTAGRPSKEKPHGEDVDWWRVTGLHMVNAYHDWWVAGPPWRIWALPDGEPAVEVPLRVSLGGVPVVGYVDQVLESIVDGGLLVVDRKTGTRKPFVPTQLAGYAVELGAVFARPFNWGSYFMAREGQLTDPEPLSHWTAELLGETYKRMDQAERLGLYLPNIGSHCSSCLVRKWCPPTGGQEYQEAA